MHKIYSKPGLPVRWRPARAQDEFLRRPIFSACCGAAVLQTLSLHWSGPPETAGLSSCIGFLQQFIAIHSNAY